jgi:hypothetical protein
VGAQLRKFPGGNEAGKMDAFSKTSRAFTRRFFAILLRSSGLKRGATISFSLRGATMVS